MGSLLPLAITLLIQSFSSLALVVVPVLVPTLTGVPRLTAAGIGLYLVCGYAGAVTGSLGASLCVERWGAIRASRYALMLSAVGMLIAAWRPSAMPLAALLIGIGYGPITPASSHLLIQTTPRARRSFVFSVKQTGVPLGVALAGLIVPPMAPVFDWAWTLTLLAGSCVAVATMALPIQAQLDSPIERATPRPADLGAPGWRRAATMVSPLFRPLALIFGQRDLRSLAMVSFLFSTIQMSFTSYIVSYLTHDLALAAVLAGMLLAVSQLGGVAGRIAWGYLSDRVTGPLPMLAMLATVIALCALSTAGLKWLSQPPPTLLIGGLMLVFGATASGWNGVYLAEVATRAPPGKAGTATAGTLACTFFGVIVGAPLFGALASGKGGFPAGFLALALSACAAVAVLLFLIRNPAK